MSHLLLIFYIFCNNFFEKLNPHVFFRINLWDNFSVQSRPHFCVVDAEYSILVQNEMIMESY